MKFVSVGLHLYIDPTTLNQDRLVFSLFFLAWGDWSQWLGCSAPCGQRGISTRTRFCDGVEGKLCGWDSLDQRECNNDDICYCEYRL